MRTVLKQQTENFIQVIQKAHKVLGEAVDACNLQTALQILEECQAGAISLGTTIEEYEGEGFVTVGILEEYCEHIYQTYEALSQNHFVDSKKVCQELDDIIAKVWDSIKDMPVKKEVVFLPYKASMWDSLESVWMAADADPECDAYVIPIPYYDKNPDGTFKEMHYEGDLYPDYVPITDYNSYDFQSRRPDKIFIHNPYDGNNYITSVHPFFYSSNLKNFTDKLVYIPYFVLGDIDPKNETAVKGMEHFVTVPGVIHAHTVIVQSENMRQVYIDVMSRMAGENTRSYWEGKILGLGSPKFDKVHNAKKENVKVPEEWLDIIQKPDGSWKKVIFYNTSVGALLQNGEKMLEKMKDVFRTFEDNKEEVALLWRPHPLMKATIESMRPQLWEEYQKIVEQYKDEGWGIYDDTADMDRAIALCDGYYGDPSSLVQLCEEAGKPVMLQDVNINASLQNRVNIIIEDAIWTEEKIWFCAQNFNSLFCMDTATEEIKLVGMFPNEPYTGKRLYSSIELINNKIYCVPFWAKEIVVYDIEKNEFYNIVLDEKVICHENGRASFMGVKRYKEYLYMLPVFCSVIIRLNLYTQEIQYLSDWVKQIEPDIFDLNDGYFRKQAVIKDGRMFIPFCNANAVLELDCDTLESKIHKLGSEKRGYSGITFDGKNFWLSSRTWGSVTKWNFASGVIETISLDKNCEIEKPYVGIAWCENEINVFSSAKKERLNNNETNIIAMREDCSFVKEEKEILLYYQNNTGNLIMFDKNSDKQSKVKISADASLVDTEKLFTDTECMMEFSEFNLQCLLSVMKEKSICIDQGEARNIGRYIYSKLE